ncbi:hypothetical protein HanOQP8_Chr06g0215311 [Helianthus annuus]|nr:hypothetical protein HanOQP8_Chr06g0215311 [Helianthus annuus]
MWCFQTNVTGFGHPLPPQVQPSTSLPKPEFPPPSSPLPFGCLPPSLSLRFPFSSTNQFGFQQLTPLSPPPAPSQDGSMFDDCYTIWGKCYVR